MKHPYKLKDFDFVNMIGLSAKIIIKKDKYFVKTSQNPYINIFFYYAKMINFDFNNYT